MNRTRSTLALGLLIVTAAACSGESEPVSRAVAQPTAQPTVPGIEDLSDNQIIARFWKIWSDRKVVFHSYFLGVKTMQNPNDAWIVQEIISEVVPDVIVEAGTFHGGSAALWALFLEQLNPDGRVVTIDIEDQREPAAKEFPIVKRRVEFLLGSSTDPAIVAQVKERTAGKKTLVLLDSLHTEEHVFNELELYTPLVSVGSYMIVQDTFVGGGVAIQRFLKQNPDFEIDKKRERFMITNTFNGYLRRVR